MKIARKVALLFFILPTCVGCDQATKEIARQSLAGTGTLHFWGDTLRLCYAENTGCFLSLGAHFPAPFRSWLFTALVGGGLLALLLYLLAARAMTTPLFLALTLVLAGGLGNLLDRLFHDGRVVDFLNVGLGPLRTGIFNVADVAITGGAGWFAWLALRHPRGKAAGTGSPPSSISAG